MLGILCIGVLLLPFILFLVFVLRDRLVEKRDDEILERSRQIANLFNEIGRQDRKLTRVYLQASSGDAYPYDLFMIEYAGGAHPTDTIWLPVRHFFNASDDTIKRVLASELAHPGKYTIPDWQEAVYQFVLREKQNPYQKRLPAWKRWLKELHA